MMNAQRRLKTSVALLCNSSLNSQLMGEERKEQLAYEAFRQNNGTLHDILQGNPALTHSLAAQLRSGRNPVIPAETAATVQLTIGLPPSHQASHLLQAVGSAIKTNHKCLRRFVRKLKRKRALQSVAEKISNTYSEFLSQCNQSESEDSDVEPENGQRWWYEYTFTYVTAVIFAVFAVLVVVYQGFVGSHPLVVLSPDHSEKSGDEANPLLTYSDNLRHLYLERHEAAPSIYDTEWQWPRLKKSQFIRLALVKMEYNHADEFTRRTIVGSVDDILRTKEEITFQKVFQFDHGSKGARILIEGRPGSGKTTLMGNISREWAEGNILADCVVFLLVPLRSLVHRNRIHLEDLLGEYFPVGKISVIEDWLLQNGGDGLCLGLDGIDEHPAMAVKGNYVFKAFLKGKFPNSCIILASRPAATESLREEASKSGKYIEVVGFLKEEIRQFISEYYAEKNKPNKSEELLSYLEAHPNVMHMAYLPLNLVIIVYLFDLMGTSLPETETDIYTEFTRQTLIRYAHKNGSDDCEIHTLDSLCREVPAMQECFAVICQLAYKSLRENELIFGEKDLPSNICNGLGLLIEDRTAGLSGIRRSYSFLHLTFQEFLAAFHITRLLPSEQIQAFNSTVRNTQRMYTMDEVFKFYAGLTRLNTTHSFEIFKIYLQHCDFSSSLSRDIKTIVLLSAFESNSSSSATELLNAMKGVVEYRFELTPRDYLALNFLLITANHAVKQVEIGCKALSSFPTSKSFPELRIIRIHPGPDRVVDVSPIRNLIEKSPNLEEFNMLAISDKFEYYEFNRWHIIENWDMYETSNENICSLVSTLANCPNLQKLKLGCGSFGEKGAACLTQGLRESWKNLKVLWLDFTDMGNEGFSELAARMRGDTEYLELMLYIMGRELQEMKLTNRKVGDEGICSLVAALTNNSKLEKLGLPYIVFGDKGAACLAQALRESWKDLKSLSLDHNEMGDKGLLKLSTGLRSSEELEELWLTNNKLGDEGVCSLAAALSSKPKFQRLMLNYEDIGDKGAACLAQVLEEGWIKHVRIVKNDWYGLHSTGVDLLRRACTTMCSVSFINMIQELLVNDMDMDMDVAGLYA